MILDNQMLYILLGGGSHIVLWLSYKILKKPKTYLILLLLSSIIGLFGYSNLNRQSLKMINGNAAEWTFFPLLFMIYYWLLRKIFLIIFKEEPLMTDYMQSSWEQGEYRKLHFGNAFFTILTLILPYVTTLLFF